MLVRHGETDSNKNSKAAGQRVDDLLNDSGIEQIKKLSEKIETDFDIIFSSPLMRAKQSAEIIAEKIGAPIIERAEIVERDYGTLSGISWDEFRKILKEKGSDWKEENNKQCYDFRMYDGENAADVKRRFLKFVKELRNDYGDKKVLIVTHGGILRMAHFLFAEIKVEYFENASMYDFEI